MKSPIFIFSLPRSGSTLLQRVLMGHKDIASTPEPWILLPFLYTQKKEGVLSEYVHCLSQPANTQFIEALPNKRDDFDLALREFFNNLYQKQCKDNETYFLDKTPRNVLIIPQIIRLFPNAKFIFLFRNPIQIMSSIMETFCNGSFKGIYGFSIDLYKGYNLLSEGYIVLKDRSYALQYEKFIRNPEKHLHEICAYLDIQYAEDMLEKFSLNTATIGMIGDTTGTAKYNTIDTEPLQLWKKTMGTKFRISQVKKYVLQLNPQDLQTQGYHLDELLAELNEIKPKFNIPIKDYFDVVIGKLILYYNLNIRFSRDTRSWVKGTFLK